ncbi:hypothetical protein PIB30_096137, partial [Stylosanthes scabra]|nr:hypothetical protein [Stylosanthes scabra]
VEILQVVGLDLVNHVWAKSGTWSKCGLVLVRERPHVWVTFWLGQTVTQTWLFLALRNL